MSTPVTLWGLPLPAPSTVRSRAVNPGISEENSEQLAAVTKPTCCPSPEKSYLQAVPPAAVRKEPVD